MLDLAGCWTLSDESGAHVVDFDLPGDGISALVTGEHEKVLAERGLSQAGEFAGRVEHRQAGAGDISAKNHGLLRQLHHHRHARAQEIRLEILVLVAETDAPKLVAQGRIRLRSAPVCDRHEAGAALFLDAHEMPAGEGVLAKVDRDGRLAAARTVDLEVPELRGSDARHDRGSGQDDRAGIIYHRAEHRDRLALGLRLDEKLHGNDRLEPLIEQLGQRRGGGGDGEGEGEEEMTTTEKTHGLMT